MLRLNTLLGNPLNRTQRRKLAVDHLHQDLGEVPCAVKDPVLHSKHELRTPITPDAHPLTFRFTYGTSAYQPVDDPHGWPHPNGPALTQEETRALSAKLAYLHTVAAELKQQLEPADDSRFVSLLEDEGAYEVRYAIPEALPAQIDAYLEAGAERLAAGDVKGAVAQLRTAEVLLRLVLGWGQAEMQAFVPGVAGLEKGETAAVAVETKVAIDSEGREKVERVTSWLED